MLATGRTDYLKFGDSNTMWFRSRASRRSKNLIKDPQDEDSMFHTESNNIDEIVIKIFSKLFSYSGNLVMNEFLDCIPSRITEPMNDPLCLPCAREEMERAIKQMHPLKAGWYASFFLPEMVMTFRMLLLPSFRDVLSLLDLTTLLLL